jgi:hypothetical protein
MKGSLPRLRSCVAFSIAVTVVAVAPTLARAADPPPAPAPVTTEIMAKERPSTRSFYGWQILATGEAGGVLAAASALLPDKPLGTWPSTFGFIVGMPFYALGGPATHWTHDEFQKGLISLAANFVFPLAGGFTAKAVRCSPSDAADDCGTRGFFTGFSIALVTVPIVDALVLGWEYIPDDELNASAGGARSRAASRPPSFTMTPTWSVGPRGGFELGVAGRF